MIIDKILAHGVYEQHSGFVKYTFKYDATTDSIIIHIQTANVDKFAGTTEQERIALQRKFYKQWNIELMSELEFIFREAMSDDIFVIKATVADDDKTLTITAEGLKAIIKFVENNEQNKLKDLGYEELPLAIRHINALRAQPFETLDSSLLAYHDALLRINAQNTAEQSASPPVLSLSPLAAPLSQPTAAFQNGTSEFVEKEVSDEDYRDNKVYKAAAKSLAEASPPKPSKKQEPINNFSLNTLYSESPAVDLIIDNADVCSAAQNNANLRVYKNKSKNILNQLQDSVYDRIKSTSRGELLPHGQKEFHINEMKNIVRPIKDIEILSDIYHFINYAPNKKTLNVHEHSIYDTVFFKKNTNSWQVLIDVIRKQAFKVLLNNLGIGDIIIDNIIKHENTAIDGNNPVTIQEPQKVIDTLKPYLEDKLFCEHRSNNFFRNNFHATTAVKNLRKVIEVCKTQIERNKQPIFEH